MINAIQTAEYARALLQAKGPKAEAVAAAKAQHCSQVGKIEQARDWTRILQAIHAKRGPIQG